MTGTSHSDIGVRRATPADAEAIGDVQAAVWRAAYADVVPAEALAVSTPTAFADAWRSSLGRATPDHALLVAHEGAAVVGLAALGPSDDPDLDDATTIDLLVLGVAPARRRAGHGSRLLAAVADLARQRGARRLTAWVLIAHEETRAFLQGAGFGPDGARRRRIVDPDGGTVLEVRLVAGLDEPTDAATPGGDS